MSLLFNEKFSFLFIAPSRSASIVLTFCPTAHGMQTAPSAWCWHCFWIKIQARVYLPLENKSIEIRSLSLLKASCFPQRGQTLLFLVSWSLQTAKEENSSLSLSLTHTHTHPISVSRQDVILIPGWRLTPTPPFLSRFLPQSWKLRALLQLPAKRSPLFMSSE